MTRTRDIKVTLLYPPHQAWPGYMCKPNGSLAYPSLAGALREAGFEVDIFDACVGTSKDDLEEMFYVSQQLPSGLLRTGVKDERILEEVRDAHMVGLTSIFSDQETMVLAAARLIKQHFPEKLIVAGGVNARNRLSRFFDNSVDVVCTSEAERTIVHIARKAARGDRDWSDVSGVAYRADGRIVVQPIAPEDMFIDLDRLPMPAWDLLPNERYWKIARPHGGHFRAGQELRYASMMTSMGCPFSCSYCHISGETEDSPAGDLAKFRIKSDERVLAELDELKRLGVSQLFIEDDSLFGMKRRGINLIRKVRGYGFDIFDVNGVNLVHLLRKTAGGKFEPDETVLDCLVEAGFRQIALPFESASQRIITKYASNKWNVERCDVESLIRRCVDKGIEVSGNYMLGYPDETREEIQATIEMARRHRSVGLASAAFMLVIPLPGTRIYDLALAGGHLKEEFNPDTFNWSRASLINTTVPPEELMEIRRAAWESVNDPKYVVYKKGMNADVHVEPTDFFEDVRPTVSA
jgi:anaerobic magnesium-protoporphyrin IX monomethyl ester cyclase